jgi:hypothetical protein
LLTTGGGTGLATVGTNGQVLTSNGTTLSWVTPTAVTPGGSNTQVQFNSSGSFAGSSNFVWDGTNVGIGTSSPSSYGTLSVVSSGNPVIYVGSTGSGTAGGITIQGNGAGSYPSLNFTQTATNYWTIGQRGDTNLHFYRQAGSGSFIIDSGNAGINGYLGVGTTSPSYPLSVSAGVEWPIQIQQYVNSTSARITILFQKSLGTSPGSPAAVTSGTYLGGLSMAGYDGSAYTLGYNGGAEIIAAASENWTSTKHGSQINFLTTPIGTSGSTTTLTITSSGSIQLVASNTNILNANGRPMVNQTGGILQVVNFGTVTQTTTSSSTYITTGLTASITPSTTSSKILILITCSVGSNSGSYSNLQLWRNGSNISTFAYSIAYTAGNTVYTSYSYNPIDTPASTSTQTYTVYFNSANATGTARFNSDNSTSSITLMEIAA